MGLNAGPVPPRVDGPVKQALLGLAADAVSAGFSLRQAATWLGVNHTRLLQWRTRDQAGRGLHDEPAGPVPGEVLHALLDWEKAAIIALAADWERVDLSHRKLAHRGSRLDVVYVSESSVLRVLTEAGVRLPGLPALPRRERTPFPDWAELVPGVVWCYDFTHFSGLPGWCAIAVVDVISKYCLALNLCPEETSIQVENAFIDALQADGKAWLLDDEEFLAELTTGHVPDPDFDHLDDTSHLIPVLLAVSDNGPQMTSKATAKFMAAARIGQHFGRPGLDRVVLRAPEDREPAPGHDQGPCRPPRRARPPGRALQHRAPPRGHRLRHPRRRAPRPRASDPQGPPRRTRTGPSQPCCHPTPQPAEST